LPWRHPIFGVPATPVPSFTFLAVGIALGPAGVGVIAPAALQRLDTVITVGLAILGVSVGLGVGAARMSRTFGRELLAVVLQAAITMGVVALGLWLLLRAWDIPLPGNVRALVAFAAIAAGASAAAVAASGQSARIADLDDVPVIAAGALLLAVTGGSDVVLRLVLTLAAAAAVGLAGHLLFEGASRAERGVFVGGAILLLGGIGAYLHTSPLLSGLAAALLWVRLPSAADRITSEDLARYQHPLLALLLIVAGASITWSVAVLWIGGALAVLRLAAKLAAGFAIARLVGESPSALAGILVPPGVIGLALALNAWQVLDTGGGVLVGSVTVAVMLTEAAAMFLSVEHEEPGA
jgi:hypothetical protein